MGYVIKKVTTKIYEIEALSIDMFEAKSFLEIRRKMKNKLNKCFKCNRAFTGSDEERITLAFTKKGGNKVLCRTCAEEVASTSDVKVFRKDANEKSTTT